MMEVARDQCLTQSTGNNMHIFLESNVESPIEILPLSSPCWVLKTVKRVRFFVPDMIFGDRVQEAWSIVELERDRCIALAPTCRAELSPHPAVAAVWLAISTLSAIPGDETGCGSSPALFPIIHLIVRLASHYTMLTQCTARRVQVSRVLYRKEGCCNPWGQNADRERLPSTLQRS